MPEHCKKRLANFNGYRFHDCGKPAKFNVWFADGPVLPYCGTHANQAKRRGGNVVTYVKQSNVSE